MDDLKFDTQQLSVVANFLCIKEAENFLTSFERNFLLASICSRTFRSYPKFKYAYWFDWVLIVEDINAARNEIKNYFGSGWIESGDDEIWNAENKQEFLVPFWAKLSAPNFMSIEEALHLNPEPQRGEEGAFVSISTQGKVTGVYPII
ncbi:hypothetical protein [Chamaesiphon sp. GL140_3_metabinner_50]|uniref:hypothetical protein n=1 Tax=Chamaesiphon sp. GL140_3_metabinner_50 TaxID=2970812 RepID=UPI0025E35ABF|nr:hypothetical protein [Chamaesiphon sp. GL140_3_metabinner_50]